MRSQTGGAEQYVLALDMGSSSVKSALVSARGEVAGTGFETIETILLPGGGAEQNPNQWWNSAVRAARSALAASGLRPEQVRAVACTTAWSVTVPVDAAGRALANALTWMDTRGGPYNTAVVAGFPQVAGYAALKLRKWLKLTGIAPQHSGVDGMGHILFFKHERPEIYAGTHKFLEPMDYLNLRLTGRFAASYATIFPYGVTDNRDPNRIDYHADLLRLSGIDRAKMPDLSPVNAVLGTLTGEASDELGLPRSTPVVMGCGDSHAATIGAGAVGDYEGYFCIGTSAWMSCHVPFKKTDVFHQIATMPAALPGKYMVFGEQGVAGRCLEFLKDRILFPDGAQGLVPAQVYELLNSEAARVAPGADGLIFTPWINGILSPVQDIHTRSAFFNQSMGTTRGHYVRAVMEGVAFNLRWLKRHVEAFIGRRFPQLAFIGGGALSEVWCGILADVLGCPVRQVASPRSATAVGAAFAALAALGEIQVQEISSLVKVEATHQPAESRRWLYDQQFREFLDFYRRTKPIYKRLNPKARAA
ncbi:MAG: FGGY-family carbohydrate kinase [Terriglobia bacterium]